MRVMSVFQTRSFTVICFYVGLLCLTFQFVVFLILLYLLDDKINNKADVLVANILKCHKYFKEDFEVILSLGSSIGLHFILLDRHILKELQHDSKIKKDSYYCLDCDFCKPIVLGLDHGFIADKSKQFFSKIVEEDFMPVTFYNTKPMQLVDELDRIETAVFIARRSMLEVIFLYPREDNTWWFGDIRSDVSYQAKLASLNITFDTIDLMKNEGAIERFEMAKSNIKEDLFIMVPKDINSYLHDINGSKFIECNESRAIVFRSKYRPDKSSEAVRFKHKVWKMLSRVKTVLDSLGIVFWLSSGTVLGYYRECDIIAYSKDVDIGVWASSYTDQIISEMHEHGFRLKISLGFPNDSLELSFMDESGIKLDIFFFYKEEQYYWNGGTQVKSGKKFKYYFPKFTLCWTLFKDIRVRVPCEVEDYIKANYGPNWFIPVKTWDWKTSPFNVKPNGMWRTDQLDDAIKVYV